jgi:hypothetical protein
MRRDKTRGHDTKKAFFEEIFVTVSITAAAAGFSVKVKNCRQKSSDENDFLKVVANKLISD